MIYIMKNKKSFLNKKYKIFLFLPLAAIAISYLIGAAEISYIFNVSMIISPIQAGMSMNIGQAAGKPLPAFLKTVGQHSNKLNLQSFVTCLECQNLSAAYYPVTFYYGRFIKTISSDRKSYIKYLSSNILHPPQSRLI